MTKLSVNVNKVATLRNTRALAIPSPTHLARLALDAGAHGITIHPRPDERHIRATDVDEIADLLREYPDKEFNIEGNPFEGRYLEHCRRVRPTQCTLVPDTIGQSTSDHGWDLARDGEQLRPLIAELRSLGCRVSVFMDADTTLMAGVKAIGGDRVELYTEPFAKAFARRDPNAGVPFAATAQAAIRVGLGVNAGHDLNRDNLGVFTRLFVGLDEVSIGHALIADALEFGIAEAVRNYLETLITFSPTRNA